MYLLYRNSEGTEKPISVPEVMTVEGAKAAKTDVAALGNQLCDAESEFRSVQMRRLLRWLFISLLSWGTDVLLSLTHSVAEAKEDKYCYDLRKLTQRESLGK
ncbi:hypothetical protein MUK42_20480 [Musa troglodytarum]|uniref:Uncharacterized protein n=1 Tax=Musa troglodytarum TaxID=320322 RepID=A0A9E7G8K5_9LILI|nr:hypothetical protein MUK42_20480 [Musa troglodytarum]